jgi:hypothetical protein
MTARHQVMKVLNTHLREWARSRSRLAFMAIGLGAVACCELGRAYYRPYIYSNHIRDFHIADTLGNSFGTLATVFVFVSIFGRTFEQGLSILRTAALSVVVFELAHPLLGKVIDPWDILATLITAALAEVGYRRILHRIGRPNE